MFQKDVNKVMELLQKNEISLDEKKLEKYYFYIRQIEKLLGGHKCPLGREERLHVQGTYGSGSKGSTGKGGRGTALQDVTGVFLGHA